MVGKTGWSFFICFRILIFQLLGHTNVLYNTVATSYMWLLVFEMFKVWKNKFFNLNDYMWLVAAVVYSTGIQHYHHLRELYSYCSEDLQAHLVPVPENSVFILM